VAIEGDQLRQWFKLGDHVKLHAESVILSPKMWKKYKSKYGLQWNEVKFILGSANSVPTTSGLYAFVVTPPADDFPPSNWLFYIGEVGATGGNGRTLRARYKEYLSELKRMTRPSISTVLNRYRKYTSFYYCELDWQLTNIKVVESELISALWPPVNRADFELDVRSVRRAWP
jgi:hypothetical protein